MSWLSSWKEPRSLNLDFSHGLAQADVFSMQYVRRQALQRFPAISGPEFIHRVLAKATKLTPFCPQTSRRNPILLSSTPLALLQRQSLLPSPPTTTAPEMDHQRIFRYTAPGSPSLITQTLILYHRGTGPLSHTTPPITQPPLSQLGREVLTKSQRQN